MKEFDLPVLESSTLVADAFATMQESQRSGVVSWQDDYVRLVRFEYLDQALSLGQETLADVTQWDSAALMLGRETTTIVRSLEAVGLSYGVFGRSGRIARVVSVHEPKADVYLASPPGAKCRNPANPHYYPPLRRNPASPRSCVICPYPLP